MIYAFITTGLEVPESWGTKNQEYDDLMENLNIFINVTRFNFKEVQVVGVHRHRRHHSTTYCLTFIRVKYLKENSAYENIKIWLSRILSVMKTTQCRILRTLSNVKVFMQEKSWPSQGTTLAFDYRDWGKPRKANQSSWPSHSRDWATCSVPD